MWNHRKVGAVSFAMGRLPAAAPQTTVRHLRRAAGAIRRPPSARG